MGDRECPSCGEMSLLEKGLKKWECLICHDVFDEVFLDVMEDDLD